MSDPDFETGLPQHRQRLLVHEVATYFGCGEDHVYRLVEGGELRRSGEDEPMRVDRQSVIDFRRRRQLPVAKKRQANRSKGGAR